MWEEIMERVRMDIWNWKKQIIFEKRYYRTTKFQSLLCNTQELSGIMQTFCSMFLIGSVLSLVTKNPRVCYLTTTQFILRYQIFSASPLLPSCDICVKIVTVKCRSASSRQEQGTGKTHTVISDQSCWKERGRQVCCPSGAGSTRSLP